VIELLIENGFLQTRGITMKHRRASGFLLAVIVGAAASLSDMPIALSQSPTPACEETGTATALTGTDLDGAAQLKIGVTFNTGALRLSGAGPGKVISAPVSLGAPLNLTTTQMVITGARLSTISTGDIRFFMSGTEPPEWVEAHRCDNVPTSTNFCVRFPKSAGRSLRWMALMTNGTPAPSITSVQPSIDYVRDGEHHRGGITQHEGIAYYGGFTQPGDLGQLYATSLDFDTVHWRARDRLPSSGRNIYTANGTQRIPFDASFAADLAPLLGRTEPEVAPIVNWVVNTARFGVGASAGRFGAVVTSTPVVVGRPEFPVWYFRVDDPALRTQFLAFRQARFGRPPLVLYGAKDGMVHALRTNARNVTDPELGEERWAFIPSGIAARMADDFDNNLVSAYPDTWPAYDHVRFDDGSGNRNFATIAVFAHGRGGTGISAVDITDTVDPTTDAVTGPQPLWEQIPQASSVTPSLTYDPGLALNRPAIARVEFSETDDRYMVIAGTGLSYNDPERLGENGRIVMAYDAQTGALYWKFRTLCPLTTAITVFETNDQGEPGPPDLDGAMDRAVFGDYCGNIYKIDLTAERNGGWTSGIGTRSAGAVDGVSMFALFQTDDARPVTGNIGVRAVVDVDTTRVALFFGTGGLDEYPPYLQNTFYAMAAAPDDVTAGAEPEVFERIEGDCPTAASCEKFYGGVRVNPVQVFFSRVLEPSIGSGTGCESGRTIIEARSLVGDIETAIGQQPLGFPVTVDAVMTNALSGSGPTFVFLTQGGEKAFVGPEGVGPGPGSATVTADQVSLAAKANAPMLILGWRQVY
jgi:hypothetical protein